jgi:phosphatidylglycerophosphatase A
LSKLSKSKLSKNIATLGITGYLPYAPGTFGSALGFLLVLVIRPSDDILLIIIFILFVVGIVASHNAEKTLGRDSKHIVIDELCGYLLTVVFIPKDTWYLFAGFVLFRIFDILKPPPIKRVEEIASGGIGIMLDDVLAALYSNAFLQLMRYIDFTHF